MAASGGQLASGGPLPLAAIDSADWISLAIGLALVVYLVVTLLRPERY